MSNSNIKLRFYYPKVENLLDAVRFLVVDLKLDPSHQNKEGENALHLICTNESDTQDLTPVARFLVENGVDIKVKVNNGVDTALHYLCSNPNHDSSIGILRFLIEKGIDVHAKDYEGDGALHELCRNCNGGELGLNLVRVIVEAGIDVKARTLDGSTAV